MSLTQTRVKTVCITSIENLQFTDKTPHVKPTYHIGLGPNNANLPPPLAPEANTKVTEVALVNNNEQATAKTQEAPVSNGPATEAETVNSTPVAEVDSVVS